jgi:hypothetical protein
VWFSKRTLANGTAWIAEYPQSWNGTLLLYSHGFGPLTAADAPDQNTQAAYPGDLTGAVTGTDALFG